jgi:hypothetical protein
MSRRDGAIVARHGSAWDSATPEKPSRRVRSIRVGTRTDFDDRSVQIWNFKTEQYNVLLLLAYETIYLRTRRTFRRERPLGLAAPDQTVPYGTVLSTDAFPGTSCQLRSMLSLRDALAENDTQTCSPGRVALEFTGPCRFQNHHLGCLIPPKILADEKKRFLQTLGDHPHFAGPLATFDHIDTSRRQIGKFLRSPCASI